MRMKKLLTLLLTAVIGCLPMWAGAGTDKILPASVSKGTNVKVTGNETGTEYVISEITVKSNSYFTVAANGYVKKYN